MNETSLSEKRFIPLKLITKAPWRQCWQGADAQSGRKVMIKKTSTQAPAPLQRQFHIEVRVLKDLHSRWIPRLLDCFEQDGYLVCILEFFEGKTLDQWLKEKPSAAQRRRILLQLISLLQQVHAAGYVYLDLKADNVLICDGHACLIDFNAALPEGSSYPVLLSPEGAPPEVKRHEPLTHLSDQIGLGRLIQKMLGSSRIAWRCLAVTPKKRYPSLELLKKDLSRPKGYAKASAVLCALLVFAAGSCALLNPANVNPVLASENMTEDKTQPADLQSTVEVFKAFESGKIQKEDLLDPKIWKDLFQSAWKEKNARLGRILTDRHPESIEQEQPLLWCLAALLAKEIPSSRQTESALRMLEEMTDCRAGLTDLTAGLCMNGCSLPEKQFEKAEQLMKQSSLPSIEQAEIWMEFLLMEKSTRQLVCGIPAGLEEVLGSYSRGQMMMSLYRRSQ